MTLLIGALTLGIILSLLALGVYISYRIFDIADITVDGSLTFGAAVAIVGTLIGSVLFRQLVAIALSFGLNPNDLKLVTATFVFAALILPDMMGKLSKRKQPGVA